MTMNDCGLSASCVYIVSAERQSVSLGHLRFCSALCYVSKGICSREDKLLYSKAHLLFIYNIMWGYLSIGNFLLLFADCAFISLSGWFC